MVGFIFYCKRMHGRFDYMHDWLNEKFRVSWLSFPNTLNSEAISSVSTWSSFWIHLNRSLYWRLLVCCRRYYLLDFFSIFFYPNRACNLHVFAINPCRSSHSTTQPLWTTVDTVDPLAFTFKHLHLIRNDEKSLISLFLSLTRTHRPYFSRFFSLFFSLSLTVP